MLHHSGTDCKVVAIRDAGHWNELRIPSRTVKLMTSDTLHAEFFLSQVWKLPEADHGCATQRSSAVHGLR